MSADSTIVIQPDGYLARQAQAHKPQSAVLEWSDFGAAARRYGSAA